MKTHINSKTAFIISLIVITVTIMSFWIYGLNSHRSVVQNTLLSTLTLSIAFFLFLFVNLYRGAKLKDKLGKITHNFDAKKIDYLKDFTPDTDVPEVGDDIAGIIFGFVIWLFVSFVFGIILWVFGAVLWFTILVFMAMLYWIFYRATRLALKNSKKCKGQFDYSFLYAFGYTALYTCWIYGVIYISLFLS